MAQDIDSSCLTDLFERMASFVRRRMFSVLSVKPIPSHIAFIMDGNRRYDKKYHLQDGTGHRAGYVTLMNLVKYCYEMGVKYVTVYAFSIENFKRKPEEVRTLMELMQEKIEILLKEESIVNQYSIRLYFIGNLQLLDASVRMAAEKAMMATAKNNKAMLLICVPYTSTDEIVHAVQKSFKDRLDELQCMSGNCNGNIEIAGKKQDEHQAINLVDIEKNMYMAVAPDPDLLIRSSGETRLSNFLLWQTSQTLLYSPRALWPEIGLGHLVWGILNYQRNYPYIEKKKKKQV